jgi:hypothetical protein
VVSLRPYIEKVFQAEKCTPPADERNVLVTLIEA